MNGVLPSGRRPGFVGTLGNRAGEVRRRVATLLGIGSPEDLAASLIERASLTGGRVEGYEYGRDQHSSASAGAMLLGMASVPAVSHDVLTPFFRRVAGLVKANGAVNGHDGDRVSAASSWAIAQVLLGLLVGARRLGVRIPRLHKLVAALVGLQDHDSGGWPLRLGEPPRLTFSFYPVLALAHVWRSGADRSDQIARSLAGAQDYLVRCLRQPVASVEEMLLAVRALTILSRVLVGTGLVTADLDLSATADSLRERAWSSVRGLLLRNQSIVTYRLPTWAMTLWRPLFWLAVRGDASPLSRWMPCWATSWWAHSARTWLPGAARTRPAPATAPLGPPRSHWPAPSNWRPTWFDTTSPWTSGSTVVGNWKATRSNSMW